MDYSKIIEQIEKNWNPPWTHGARGIAGVYGTVSWSTEKIDGHNYYYKIVASEHGGTRVKYIIREDIKIRKEKLKKINNINE
jgi:hypothetical protein